MAQIPMEVLMTTSNDSRHSGENMLDGDSNTFWTTTGMFPQEVLLGFKENTVSLTRLKTSSCGVRRLVVQASSETQPIKFKAILDVELGERPSSSRQTETFQINSTVGSGVRFLKLVMQSGWEDFATIHSVAVDGTVDEAAAAPELSQQPGPPAALQQISKPE
eukprot:TRINITY_DN50377_c0_g1_i1.p1 TRINITY_DN50377_c0_g1~~TRINITY_DN50377_c0_g1_i1.p1  ORF type:complete len:163 (+),score=37.51 TRINITY_DN50377_c0_g1_i1:377-865(+)